MNWCHIHMTNERRGATEKHIQFLTISHLIPSVMLYDTIDVR